MWTLHLQALSFSILYYAGAALAAGNTTCLSSQLDWYTNAVGETPCMTYQRLRQICNSDYLVGSFAATTPGDHCTDQVSDCCCNSVAFALSMLCMNCQADAVPGDVAGIDAVPGTYTAYLNNTGSVCGPITNQSLPTNIQQAVCNLNIKIDNFLYNRSYWSDGSWFYRWTADFAVEQQAEYNNNTFTVCPNQVSLSASPTRHIATTITASTFLTSATLITGTASVVSTGSGNATPLTSLTSSTSSTSSSSRGAIIGGAVGGSALVIIAVLGGVYCIRRNKRPRMTQDTPSSSLGRSSGGQHVYGISFTDTEPVTTQRYNEFSPVRQTGSSRESTLPMMNSLGPEWTQSMSSSSAGASYFVHDSVSEALYSREDDAGTLIPPVDAPRSRFPPAYNPSWVSRNAPPRNSSFVDDQPLLEQNTQTVHHDDTRPASPQLVPQEKEL